MSTTEAARIAAAAFISSRPDYCYSLFHGLLDTLLRKLQSVQNATARLITGTRRCDHITPVLRELHWLPIRERVKFKVASLVRQSLSRQSPVYMTNDCCLVSNSTRRSLQSADVQTCVGDKTFCSRWTSFVKLFTGPTVQSKHHLRTVSTTAEGTPF